MHMSYKYLHLLHRQFIMLHNSCTKKNALMDMKILPKIFLFLPIRFLLSFHN
jgi:hypothetical protein